MSVNFLPKTKGFFPHDFTLIASVVGESVIGHGNGIRFRWLWRISLRPDAGVSDDRPVCHHLISQPFTTRSHSHSQRVMAWRSKYVYATYYGKILRYPT